MKTFGEKIAFYLHFFNSLYISDVLSTAQNAYQNKSSVKELADKKLEKLKIYKCLKYSYFSWGKNICKYSPYFSTWSTWSPPSVPGREGMFQLCGACFTPTP